MPGSARDLHERERARQLKAQARPRDLQETAAERCEGGPAALAYRDAMTARCVTSAITGSWSCGGDGTCAATVAEHHLTGAGNRTYCTVAGPGGQCGCGRLTRPHRYDQEGAVQLCEDCGVHFLDATGPCPGKPGR